MNILFRLFSLFFILCMAACSSGGADSLPEEPLRSAKAFAPRSRAAAATRLSIENPPSIPDLASGQQVPPKPDEIQDALMSSGRRWWFGPGFGRTLTNVGIVFLFPPYALYLLGNSGLALAGYEQVYLTDALPQAPREHVLTVYDGFTSLPGRLNAWVAGEGYDIKQ